MRDPGPLSALSSLGEWLRDPQGSLAVMRALSSLGLPEQVLSPLSAVPLWQLPAASGGLFPSWLPEQLVRELDASQYG